MHQLFKKKILVFMITLLSLGFIMNFYNIIIDIYLGTIFYGLIFHIG